MCHKLPLLLRNHKMHINTQDHYYTLGKHNFFKKIIKAFSHNMFYLYSFLSINPSPSLYPANFMSFLSLSLKGSHCSMSSIFWLKCCYTTYTCSICVVLCMIICIYNDWFINKEIKNHFNSLIYKCMYITVHYKCIYGKHFSKWKTSFHLSV